MPGHRVRYSLQRDASWKDFTSGAESEFMHIDQQYEIECKESITYAIFSNKLAES
jgi:hypothetical protein